MRLNDGSVNGKNKSCVLRLALPVATPVYDIEISENLGFYSVMQ